MIEFFLHNERSFSKVFKLFQILIILSSANTKINGSVYTIYASNSSGDPENGTVLYHWDSLSQKISTNTIFRYLIFVPDKKSAVIEIEMCEIGIVGEYFIQNVKYKSGRIMDMVEVVKLRY